MRAQPAAADHDVLAGRGQGRARLGGRLEADGVVLARDVAVDHLHPRAAVDVDAVGVGQVHRVAQRQPLQTAVGAGHQVQRPHRGVADRDAPQLDVGAALQDDDARTVALMGQIAVLVQAVHVEPGGAVDDAGAADRDVVGAACVDDRAARLLGHRDRPLRQVGRRDGLQHGARLEYQVHARAQLDAAHRVGARRQPQDTAACRAEGVDLPLDPSGDVRAGPVPGPDRGGRRPRRRPRALLARLRRTSRLLHGGAPSRGTGSSRHHRIRRTGGVRILPASWSAGSSGAVRWPPAASLRLHADGVRARGRGRAGRP